MLHLLKAPLSYVCLGILTLSSCYKPEASLEVKDTPRIHIRSLVTEAAAQNFASEDEFVKEVMLSDGQTERSLFRDPALLQADIEFLSKYDITRPAYDGLFEVDSVEERGTTRVVFVPKEGKKPDIRFFSYRKIGNQVLEAQWQVEEKNLVIHNLKFFSMQLDTSSSPVKLLGYDMDIGQKVIGRDSTWYKISVKVLD